MPQVGGKHFPYTEAGYKAADAAKKRMGHKDYRKGGLFYKTGGFGASKLISGMAKAVDTGLGADLKKKQKRWDDKKAQLLKMIPPGSRRQQIIKAQIGTRPTAQTK